jgi:hypothetical protein
VAVVEAQQTPCLEVVELLPVALDAEHVDRHQTYDDFELFARDCDRLPEVVAEVAAALGTDYIEDLDI